MDYSQDAVDQMFSGSKSAGRDGQPRPGSDISKELFSPSAVL